MRVTSHTEGALARDQKLCQLRVTLVKLYVVGGDLFNNAIAFSSLPNLCFSATSNSTSLGSAMSRSFHLGWVKFSS